jgi:formylmethanofuran dehydrogenase subunit E
MSYRTDNPIADFEKHDAEQQKALEQLPKCCECGDPIQEDWCFEYNGEPICEDCLYDNHRKSIESFM